MIAKHVQSKKGNYRRLISYLLNPQDKQERVGKVAVTQCHSKEPGIAVVEVLNTQAQNTRTTANKTYHLLISFRVGERPDDDVMRAIEERLCAGLGYGEHQRVSVVHHDTDNLHIHVAINKIHPTRHTIHTPFKDYRTLGRLCAKLEREFCLAPDNHRVEKHSSECAAADMERHAGVDSLLGWICRSCRSELCAARSWEELQHTLAANGLSLRERGNGFVLGDANGVTVKASTVDRTLSKAALEARLGSFACAERVDARASPERSYRREPTASGTDTSNLYSRYVSEQAQSRVQRTAERERFQQQRRQKIENAKRRARLKRAAIHALRCDRLTKRILYASVSRTLLSEIRNINERYASERSTASALYRRSTWVDWLCSLAKHGDSAALTALRERSKGTAGAGNALHGQGTSMNGAQEGFDSISRKGTVIYRHGATVLRDTGTRVEVSEAFDRDGLRRALELAMEQYGACIHVQGSVAFREQIARVAADMQVRFDNAGLEQLRKQFNGTTGGDHEEDRQRAGPTAGRSIPEDGAGSATRQRGADLGNIGTEPPPTARNRLRTMSELGMVRLASRGKVLLPCDVRGDMEQQGAAATHRMRRRVPPVSEADKAASAAAAKYVFDREQTRRNFSDISKHRTYDGFEGAARFAGTRKVDGVTLALLKVGQEVLVKPVDASTVNRLKRLALGAPLSVDAGGVIRTKGRSR